MSKSVVVSHGVMSNLMEHCACEAEFFEREGEDELAAEFMAASDRLAQMAHEYHGEYVVSIQGKEV